MSIQAIGSSTAVDLKATATFRARSTAESTTTSATENATVPQKSGAAPPPKVSGVAKPVESTSSASTLTTDKIVDKRDANQDGAVSYQEELLYSLKQASSENQNQAAVTTNQVQVGLNAYKQGQQVDSTTLSSTLFAI